MKIRAEVIKQKRENQFYKSTKDMVSREDKLNQHKFSQNNYERREATQINKIGNEKGDIATDLTGKKKDH